MGKAVSLLALTVAWSSAANALPANNPILTGLVAAYEFSGNADDVSGNGNDGVVNGATLAADRFGTPGSAYRFDGGSSVITAGSVISPNQSAISVAAWFYRTTPLPNSYTSNIVNQADINGDGAGFSLMLKETTGGNSRVRFLWNDQIGGRNDVSTGEIQYLQWNHVVGVYDGTTQEIYLNGSLVGSVANQGAITFPSNPFRIGHEDRPEVAGFAGRIDDVYIYDRALAPFEVNTLYNAVPEPTSATLLALGVLGLAVRRRAQVSLEFGGAPRGPS